MKIMGAFEVPSRGVVLAVLPASPEAWVPKVGDNVKVPLEGGGCQVVRVRGFAMVHFRPDATEEQRRTLSMLVSDLSEPVLFEGSVEPADE